MTKPSDSEAILYAYAIEDVHDRSTLERYLRDYPDLAQELIDLTSELRLSEVLKPSSQGRLADPGADAAWLEFLACETPAPCGEGVVSPFARLKGQAFANLAETLNIPRSFLTPFRDCQVVAKSIPSRFVARLAQAMNEPAESLWQFLDGPRPEPMALSFKSEGKPTAQGQMTFQELVDSTELTDEQRQLLLRDYADDGLV